MDSNYFSESLHFAFNERNTTKTATLDVLDSARHRKGLIDHVTLTGLTYPN